MDGPTVKARREVLYLTLREAAERAGFKSLVQWHDVESGKRSNPTVATAAAIADALECKIDDLLDSAADSKTPKASGRKRKQTRANARNR